MDDAGDTGGIGATGGIGGIVLLLGLESLCLN